MDLGEISCVKSRPIRRASSLTGAGDQGLAADAIGTQNGALNSDLQPAVFLRRFRDLTLIDAQDPQELQGS